MLVAALPGSRVALADNTARPSKVGRVAAAKNALVYHGAHALEKTGRFTLKASPFVAMGGIVAAFDGPLKNVGVGLSAAAGALVVAGTAGSIADKLEASKAYAAHQQTLKERATEANGGALSSFLGKHFGVRPELKALKDGIRTDGALDHSIMFSHGAAKTEHAEKRISEAKTRIEKSAQPLNLRERLFLNRLEKKVSWWNQSIE